MGTSICRLPGGFYRPPPRTQTRGSASPTRHLGASLPLWLRLCGQPPISLRAAAASHPLWCPECAVSVRPKDGSKGPSKEEYLEAGVKGKGINSRDSAFRHQSTWKGPHIRCYFSKLWLLPCCPKSVRRIWGGMEGPGYRPCQDVPGRSGSESGREAGISPGGWAGRLDAHVRQWQQPSEVRPRVAQGSLALGAIRGARLLLCAVSFHIEAPGSEQLTEGSRRGSG